MDDVFPGGDQVSRAISSSAACVLDYCLSKDADATGCADSENFISCADRSRSSPDSICHACLHFLVVVLLPNDQGGFDYCALNRDSQFRSTRRGDYYALARNWPF